MAEVEIRCPHCDTTYQVGDIRIGQMVSCRKCNQSFKAESTNGNAAARKLDGEAKPKSQRFEIIREIGSGAFGKVYHAHDTVLDRPVALKVAHLGVLGSEEDAKRFMREARAAGNLRHFDAAGNIRWEQQLGGAISALSMTASGDLTVVILRGGSVAAFDGVENIYKIKLIRSL